LLTGCYLLRDLTRSGHRAAVLASNRRVRPAADGVAERPGRRRGGRRAWRRHVFLENEIWSEAGL